MEEVVVVVALEEEEASFLVVVEVASLMALDWSVVVPFPHLYQQPCLLLQ